MDETWIVIPRWEEFQHYQDREVTWIKDYLRQDRDEEYLHLSLAQQGLLSRLRRAFADTHGVLSSRHTRHLLALNRGDSSYLPRNLQALNDAGFIRIVASKPVRIRTKPLANPAPRKEEEKKKKGDSAKERQEQINSHPAERRGSWCELCGSRLPPGVSLEDHQRLTHGVTV